MARTRVVGFCVFLFILRYASAYASSSPTNFQFASIPVPSPHFSSGTTDASVDASYQKQTAGTATMEGYGGSVKLRKAPSDALALGFQLPASVTKGGLGTDYGNSFTIKMTMLSPVVNLQWQAVKSSNFSALLFAGYSYNHISITLNGQSMGLPASGKATLATHAFPVGIQVAISLIGSIDFAPFFSYTRNIGGTAHSRLDSGGTVTESTDKVPGYVTQNYGFDIILPGSLATIGALIQNTLKAQSNEKDMKTFALQLGLLFGGGSRGGRSSSAE